MIEYAFECHFVDYFGISYWETFYAPDEYTAKCLCRRYMKNRNSRVEEFISVTKLG